MKSTSAAPSGGQIRLTRDPLFTDTVKEALAILRRDKGGFVAIASLVGPALSYAADVADYPLSEAAAELDISVELIGGAVRLTVEERAALDRLRKRGDVRFSRTDYRSTGIWSNRSMLVTAIYVYCGHVIAANR